MRFRDLFKPRWRRSDPQERLAAVRDLQLEQGRRGRILRELARQDPDLGVREAAVKKLVNQDVLEGIAIKDTAINVRLAALRRLTSEELLTQLARTDTDWRV